MYLCAFQVGLDCPEHGPDSGEKDWVVAKLTATNLLIFVRLRY